MISVKLTTCPGELDAGVGVKEVRPTAGPTTLTVSESLSRISFGGVPATG
jgi:hypothetical protein